jgi:uncharacterized membrane protein YphA (DoxX/SURF4 family)
MRDSQPLIQNPRQSIEQISSELGRRLDALSHRHGPLALRVSIGIVFLWFGVLKFFPSVSPAEQIAVDTLTTLTLGLVPGRALMFGLAAFETTIGACFLAGAYRRIALPLLVAHMLGTGLPFLMFPGQLFDRAPLVPTFLGQYILKNIIIVAAAVVLLRRWR